MPSKAKESFDQNKSDIQTLWGIHQKVAGGGQGRKTTDVEVLNRAAVVFITACWESYVEDVASEGFDVLLASVSSADKIPNKIRARVSDPFKEEKNSLKFWGFADGGWRGLMQSYKTDLVSSLNTPKTENVNDLFRKLLNLSKISSAWKWQRMSSERAATRLDDFITIRGEIAHRVTRKEAVYKGLGISYLTHVEKLVGITDTEVAEHLKSSLALPSLPW